MAGFQHGVPGPFAGQDLPWLLAARARSRPQHPFLVWAPFEGPTESYSYARFHHLVGQLAAGLARRGIGAGDAVLVHLENAPELLLAFFALAELGAVAVLTNTRAAPDEVAYFAAHSRAAAAMTQPSFAEAVNRAAPGLRWLAVTGHDAGAPAAAPRDDNFAALFADAADRPRRAPDPALPVAVLYTSGTTSRPKGVVWTHANALWAARVNAAHEDLRPDDVHQIYLPLFHANALGYSLLATLWAGGTAVLQPKWSTSRFWPVARAHRTSWVSFIWFSLRAVLEGDIPPDHGLRMFGFATSDPPAARRLGIPGIGWWGMTETVSHGIVGALHVPNRPGAIGRPAPEYDIRILRPGGGAPVVSGETGELFCRGVRGVSMFSEYLHDPAATAAAFDAEGWFATGDLVTLLDDGAIQFADRAKDMLKVGAENVAASEVERVVLSVPGVREAAVVGKPHPMLDEVPVAFVTVDESADPGPLPERVAAACRAALADFKVPREVRVVAEMPRATLEKIAKAELRKLLRPAGQD